ncbi:MAG: hypothetical protein R2991_06680 [Thermoanaerobaculia bacterium]
MVELMTLFGLVGMALAVLALLFVAGLALKLAFRLLLLPFALAGLVLKLVFGVALLALGLVLAPLAVVVCLVALPLLLLCGIGAAVASAA